MVGSISTVRDNSPTNDTIGRTLKYISMPMPMVQMVKSKPHVDTCNVVLFAQILQNVVEIHFKRVYLQQLLIT